MVLIPIRGNGRLGGAERRRRAGRGALTLRLAVVSALAGVALPGVGAPPAGAATPTDRVDVVASFYPLAWLAAAVGGDRVTVTDLTPPGAEPHDLELTTRDRDRIDRAAVVLVMGDDFQPAVEAAAEQRDGGVVVVGRAVTTGPAALRGDPHLWLDPVAWGTAVDVVEQALTAADPAGASTYAARAATVRQDLAALDADHAAGLADCRRRLVVSVHDAFARLAARYGLRTATLEGRAPEAEADARRMADLADRMERAGVTTVFAEPLAPADQARTLAREAGARVAVLDPVEGLTAAQRRRGDDYPTVMRRNLRALRRGLGCT